MRLGWDGCRPLGAAGGFCLPGRSGVGWSGAVRGCSGAEDSEAILAVQDQGEANRCWTVIWSGFGPGQSFWLSWRKALVFPGIALLSLSGFTAGCIMKTQYPRYGWLMGLMLGGMFLFGIVGGRSADPAGVPRVVDPGPPPSDAIVLFDGRNLDAWESEQGGPARWRIEDGAMVINGTGNIRTRRAFGDCQLHIEWATPEKVEGEGQGRGNSGVFLMARYEVQILDSWRNPTYVTGQAGAIYGQAAPLVNASRPPGQWQTYDIIFRAPRRDGSGKVVRPATITVLHNGVVVQDHFEIQGSTYLERPQYESHPDKLPLVLQDHGNPVRFRNIWIREL